MEDKVNVRFVTTDDDARSAEGVALAMQKLFPGHRVEHKADLTHLGQSLICQTMTSTFSQCVFPGKTEARKEQQQALALNLADRSYAIFSTIWQGCAHNMEQTAQHMPGVISAAIDCYACDCSHCCKCGIVCSGGVRESWWHKSFHLITGCCIHAYSACLQSDGALMRELLCIRLGEAALIVLDKDTNICKNEAVNRSLTASLPKNVNFSRTMQYRQNAGYMSLSEHRHWKLFSEETGMCGGTCT